MWLFFTFLTVLLWGVGQVFVKKGFSETTPLFNNLLSAAVTLLITIPFALLNGANINDVFSLLPLTIFIALLLLCYYYIIGIGQLSLTGTILAAYPLITVILSLLFLHEHPTMIQNFAIVLILFGTVVISVGEDIRKFTKLKIGNWFWWAIFGAFSIGISDFLAKIALNRSNTYTYLLAYSVSFIAVILVSFIVDKNGRKYLKGVDRKFIPTIVGVIMVESGVVSYYLAISQGLLSLVTPLSSIYATVTVILAWFILHERINKIQILGIICSVIGIVLIGS